MVSVAMPLVRKVVPRFDAPSKNVTEPVAMEGTTAAVRVMGVANVALKAEGVRVADVALSSICVVMGGLVAGESLASPL